MSSVLLARVKAHPTYTAAILAVAGWLAWEPLRASLPDNVVTRWLLFALLAVTLGAGIRVGHDVLMWLGEADQALREKREREKVSSPVVK